MILEIYKKLKTYKETPQKSIYLVENEIDGLLYIQRVLTNYNLEVYQKLKNIHHQYLPIIYELIEKDHIYYRRIYQCSYIRSNNYSRRNTYDH